MFAREEQKFILKMLDEGKITAVEAEKLLNALNNSCCCDYEYGKKKFDRRLNKICRCMRETKDNVCNYVNDKVAPAVIKMAQCVSKKAYDLTKNWDNELKKSSDSNCDNNNACNNNCGCDNDF